MRGEEGGREREGGRQAERERGREEGTAGVKNLRKVIFKVHCSGGSHQVTWTLWVLLYLLWSMKKVFSLTTLPSCCFTQNKTEMKVFKKHICNYKGQYTFSVYFTVIKRENAGHVKKVGGSRSQPRDRGEDRVWGGLGGITERRTELRRCLFQVHVAGDMIIFLREIGTSRKRTDLLKRWYWDIWVRVSVNGWEMPFRMSPPCCFVLLWLTFPFVFCRFKHSTNSKGYTGQHSVGNAV